MFFSYAHANRESVVAVDQWLRDHGFRVELDERDFIAGRDIRDEIMRCIERSGKVVFFYSAESKDRYYTKLEQRFVQEKEQKAHVQGNPKVLLVYFRLDETPLPLETSHRLAINAWNMSFQGACLELRRHLLEESAESTRVPLAQYASRPPWKRQV